MNNSDNAMILMRHADVVELETQVEVGALQLPVAIGVERVEYPRNNVDT